MRNPAFMLILALVASTPACSQDPEEAAKPCDGVSGNCVAIAATATESDVQKALIVAKAGDTIAFPEKKFVFTTGLSLDADGVTIKGMGMHKTILSFKGQAAGSEGLLVTGDNFLIHDIALEDTTGDALKLEGSKGVTIRRVRAEWTNGPSETNGAYGLYPVQCEDVLIEHSIAKGASDAGIYVGQSKNIIVRRNRAEFNVAGIEIENSQNADVYENVSTHNTGGILVFSLPGLDIKEGRDVRVFDNKVIDNNTDNFAPKGNIVGYLPTGTGLMAMANTNVELFRNEIRGNNTLGVLIVSYIATEIEIKDASYFPYPVKIHIHDNTFIDGGLHPGGSGNNMRRPGDLQALAVAGSVGKTPLPDIAWDGYYDGVTTNAKMPDKLFCIQNNGDGDFVNLDLPHTLANVTYDIESHNCALPALPAVVISGVQ